MTIFHKGDIVLVSFDFTDSSASKWRPAVIISSDEYNAFSPDVIIASITGNLKALPHTGDHLIIGWKNAGLKLPSLAQIKLATVEKSILGRKLGRMPKKDMDAINNGLQKVFGW